MTDPSEQPRSLTLHPNPYRAALLGVALGLAGAGLTAFLIGAAMQNAYGGNGAGSATAFVVGGYLLGGAVLPFLLWLTVASIIRSLEQGRREYRHPAPGPAE